MSIFSKRIKFIFELTKKGQIKRPNEIKRQKTFFGVLDDGFKSNGFSLNTLGKYLWKTQNDKNEKKSPKIEKSIISLINGIELKDKIRRITKVVIKP